MKEFLSGIPSGFEGLSVAASLESSFGVQMKEASSSADSPPAQESECTYSLSPLYLCRCVTDPVVGLKWRFSLMFPVVSRMWPAAEGHGRELVVGLSETFPLSSLGLFSCCVLSHRGI